MTRPKPFVSVTILVVLVTFWIGMAEIGKKLQSGCGTGDKAPYAKPYAMTYVIHAGYAVFLPIVMLWNWIEGLLKGKTVGRRIVQWGKWRVLLSKCAFFGMFTFCVGYTYYAALPLLPVAINVAIYNSASAFVYAFALLAGLEHFDWRKVLALCFSIAGVLTVQLMAKQTEPEVCPGRIVEPNAIRGATAGYILISISTLTYAGYEVLYKRLLGPGRFRSAAPLYDRQGINEPLLGERKRRSGAKEVEEEWEEPVAVSRTWDDVKYACLALGMIGVFHVVLMWPGFFVLDALGVETMEWPARDAAISLVVTTVLDTWFNALLLIGIAVTSPLFISVGCLLTIPASILADWLLYKELPNAGSFAGIGLILFGFGVLAWAERREAHMRSLAPTIE